ncbi:MAG: hypothetical protein HOW73_30365 [Polyangiaceae bacterium]|nr:hypothetical protein [Polyangiaceae bacterium]
MLKRFWLFAAVFFALFAAGCAPPWTVIKQAEPNPFAGKKEFVVLPIDYEGLMVGNKTEAEYLGEKKDKTVDRFEQDKVDMNDLFTTNLQAVAKDEGIDVDVAAGEVKTFVIKPHIGFMEPGFYAVVASAPSEVVLRLKIEDKDGKVLDEIEIKHQTPPSNWGNVAAGSRYRQDAEWIGRVAGRYLTTRVYPDD